MSERRKMEFADIDRMGVAELKAAIASTEEDILRIRGQLNMAKGKKASGEPMDSQWYFKADSAMKIKSQLLIRMQRRLKSFKSVKTVENYFVDLARVRLHKETFEELLRDARDLQAEAEKKMSGGEKS